SVTITVEGEPCQIEVLRSYANGRFDRKLLATAMRALLTDEPFPATQEIDPDSIPYKARPTAHAVQG
ncbi:MAG: hypothetical protein ABGX10_02130, partial [Paracoccus sp. (in: a-proteobacteria)]|uniref:hypothetical protein n=1 Tax=Paracoccus sp. TaxID=267 RepID=UPI003242523F